MSRKDAETVGPLTLLIGTSAKSIRPDAKPVGLKIEARDHGETSAQHQQKRREQARHDRVPPAPARGPFDRSHRPSHDRLARLESPEVFGQGLTRFVAFGRVLLKAFQGDRLDVARKSRHQPRRRDRLGRLHLLERVEQSRAPERRAAGEEFVEHRPQRVEVRRRADLLRLPLGLLGGHVAGRAQDRLGRGQPRVHVQELRQAKVGDFRRPFGRDENVARLRFGVLFVFIVLLFEFRTFAAPISILCSALLSTSGVFLALLVTRTSFNISSFMGLIMVIGIVAKNGILLLDADQKYRGDGLSARESMVLAGRRRMRPIVMTALAAAAGMFPLALALGAGSQMLQPLAIAVIGGIAVSMVLSLIITPTVHYYLSHTEGD